MTAVRALTIALACVLPLSAMAQWQWVDKSGRQRLQRPGAAPGHPRQEHPQGPERPHARARAGRRRRPRLRRRPAQAASAPKVTGRDKELEARKKQAEAAEAEKKKAAGARRSPRPAPRIASARARRRPRWIPASACRASTTRASARSSTTTSAPAKASGCRPSSRATAPSDRRSVPGLAARPPAGEQARGPAPLLAEPLAPRHLRIHPQRARPLPPGPRRAAAAWRARAAAPDPDLACPRATLIPAARRASRDRRARARASSACSTTWRGAGE